MAYESFFSALKRKQLKDVATEALRLLGEEVAAEELAGTSRLTNAAIDRAILATKSEDVEDATEEIAEEMSEITMMYLNIEKAIDKGKAKKAIKLIKAAEADGHGGSVLEDLKKKAKALKKKDK